MGFSIDLNKILFNHKKNKPIKTKLCIFRNNFCCELTYLQFQKNIKYFFLIFVNECYEISVVNSYKIYLNL